MPSPSATHEWLAHTKDASVYVSADHRMCPGCPDEQNIHPLSSFRKNVKQNTHSVLCRRCVVRDQEYDTETTENEAVRVLTSTLAKATKRRTGGPSFTEVLDATCLAMGGTDGAFELTGKVFNKILRKALDDDADSSALDRAIKVGATLIGSAATCEKTKGPPIDLSSLSPDEIQMILAEPAKKMLLSDPDFRQQLLDDPVVRKLLLGDSGVEVIETTATSATVIETPATPADPGGESWE